MVHLLTNSLLKFIIIEMEIAKYPNFMPLNVASNHFQQWRCDIDSKTDSNVYYKCLQGQGEIDLENGCKYRGQIKNGLFQGKGTFYWPNGMIYQGSFKSSHMTGAGKYTWPNGSFYEGQVLDGKKSGQGTFYSATQKYTYIGQWKQGIKQGKGKIEYFDSSIYEGDFKNNQRNGYGKMIYSSKNEYEGQWKNDKKQGKGTMNWINNHQRYIGQWKQDMLDGYGQYYWYENKTQFKTFKNVYKGYWKNGKRSGYGTFFYSHGCRFQGYFIEGIKEGPGITTDQRGVSKLQFFQSNRPIQATSLRKSEIKIKNSLSPSAKQVEKKLGSKTHSKNQSDLSLKKQISQTNKTTNLLNSAKEAQRPTQNQYINYIDFTHPQFNQNFYNFLLRNNTRFRNLYKMFGSSNNQLKDFYSGMVMENYWKALRQCRLLSQNYSLVAIDRLFSKGKHSYFDLNLPQKQIIEVLVKQNKFDANINYQDVLWNDYFRKVDSTKLDWDSLKLIQESSLSIRKPQPRTIDIHNPSRVVLFRHFVCLVIKTALLIDQSSKSLKEKIQSLLTNLQHDPLTKNQKCQDNNTLTMSAKMLNVPQWAKNIHQQLVDVIEGKQQDFNGKLDICVPVRKLYSVLYLGNIFKDQSQKILYIQKIQRYLNIKNSPLRKQYRQIYTELDQYLKSNPYFNYIMNYELNIKQVNQFLFLIINKKIIAANQQQFQNKYKEIVKNLINQVKAKINGQDNAMKLAKGKLKLKCKVVEPEKDKAKKLLLAQMEQERLRKLQEEENQKRKARQQRERKLMSKQDHDTEDMLLENQDSEDY